MLRRFVILGAGAFGVAAVAAAAAQAGEWYALEGWL